MALDPQKDYPNLTRQEFQRLGNEEYYRALMLNEAREQTAVLREIRDRLPQTDGAQS